MARTIFNVRPGLGTGVAAFAVLLAVAVIGVSALRGASADAAPEETAPLTAQVFTITYDERARITEYFPGLIAARRESALGFEQGGRIAQIAVDVGDRVEAGETLARLDTRTLEAQLNAARAQAVEAAAQADLAQVTLTRQRTLVEQGHISPQRLDETQANASAADARRAAARASAVALEVRLELASLTAPYAGVVTARMADEGAIAAPGAPVLQLVEADALEVRVGLPGRQARGLTIGESYPVEADGRVMDATLRAVTGVVERRSRTVTALFDLPAGADASAGEVARLSLPTPLERRGFWAPVSALAEARRGLWAIYVLNGDSAPYTIEPRTVEVIHTEGERVWVSGAVREGERALASGLQRVTPGQRVVPAGEG